MVNKISVWQIIVELKFNLLEQGFYTNKKFAKEMDSTDMIKYLFEPYLRLVNHKKWHTPTP